MFANALRSGRYIDKSLFIKDFLERSEKLMLITYPSKWCKSTNIDMLAQFLSIEFDKSNGKIYNDVTQTDNYKMFHGN